MTRLGPSASAQPKVPLHGTRNEVPAGGTSLDLGGFSKGVVGLGGYAACARRWRPKSAHPCRLTRNATVTRGYPS